MDYGERKDFRKGKVFCTQGSALDKLFVLRQGRVEVPINITEECPGTRTVQRRGIVVEQVDALGSFVGETGLFVHYRTASLRAAENPTTLEVIEIGDGGAPELIARRPDLGIALCRNLAVRWATLIGRVRNVNEAVATIRSVYDSLTLAYLTFVDGLAASELGSDIGGLLASARQSPVYAAARAVQDHGSGRASSLRLFDDELSRQRGGVSRVPAGTELCKQGDLGKVVYLVREGRLRISAGGQKVAAVEAGELAGEDSALLPSPARRVGAIKAEVDSVVATVPAEVFLGIALERPEVLTCLARTLCQRIEVAYRMGSDFDRLIQEELNLLAGGPDSCEVAFKLLARGLPSGDRFGLAVSRARAQADRAAEMRKSMARSLG
jgi:CRP-like cAMP-binding protein